MKVFGILMLIVLVLFALTVLTLYSLPYIIAEIKSFKERMHTAIKDKKLDIEKRSQERQHRDEIKRTKDFELANKKLDAKLNKLDKQIKILDEKQAMARQLKKTTVDKKAELNNKPKPEHVEEQQTIEDIILPENNQE